MNIRASSRITCECGWSTGWSPGRSIRRSRWDHRLQRIRSWLHDFRCSGKEDRE